MPGDAVPAATAHKDAGAQYLQKYRSVAKIAYDLGFNTPDEFNKWWNSDIAKPAFDELFAIVIKPKQDKTQRQGKYRKRLMNFTTVQTALHEDLQTVIGLSKYGARRPNKANWTDIDHYAYAIHCIQQDNFQHGNGIFISRPNLTVDDQYAIIWSILGWATYEMAPERQRTLAQAERRKAQRESANDPPKVPGPAENDMDTPLNPDTREASYEPPEHIDSRSSSESIYEPPEDVKLLVTQGHPSEDEEDEDEAGNLEAEIYFSTDPFATVEDSTLRALDLSIRNEELRTYLRQVSSNPAQSRLNSYDIMLIERRDKFNLDDRWHRYHLLANLRDRYPNTTYLEGQQRVMTVDALDDEDLAWRTAILDAKSGGDMPFRLVTDEDREVYRSNSLLLDDPRFQRQGHVNACFEMGIPYPEKPRFEVMPPGCFFFRWQIVCMKAISDFERRGLRGMLLCDAMGLGKTWEIVGFLISRLLQREEMKISGKSSLPNAKPTIIVALPHLIKQWEIEIRKIAGQTFRVIKYYDDYRKYSSVIKEPLTRKHEIFADCDETTQTIILTTPQTLAQRHGPSTLCNWRVKERGFSKEAAEGMKYQNDGTWPQNLDGAFRYAVIDETRAIRNPRSSSHTAISWLNADFNILKTVTPDAHSIDDHLGYVNLIQSQDPSIWSGASFTKLGIDSTTNPYALADEHPAARVLRPTKTMLEKFILNANISDTLKGKYLASFYASCMIRRSYASKIEGKAIGHFTPALVAQIGLCRFTKAEAEQYRSWSKVPLSKLVQLGPDGNYRWNWEHLRMLLLLCCWLGFYRIESKFTAEHVKKLLVKDWDSDNALLAYICQQYCKENPDEIFPETTTKQLELVCKGAPKIRALLRTVADVVVKNREKMIIFTSLPAQMVLIYACLKALKISVSCFHAGLKPEEKAALQIKWNQTSDPEIIIGGWATMSMGLNMQRRCHWVVFFDPAPNQSTGDHAVCRVHRLGQELPVQLITLLNEGTFNDRQVQNNLRKVLPGVMANLNHDIFGGINVEDHDEGTKVDMGYWAVYRGRLIPFEDPNAEGCEILTGITVIEYILHNRLGDQFKYDGQN